MFTDIKKSSWRCVSTYLIKNWSHRSLRSSVIPAFKEYVRPPPLLSPSAFPTALFNSVDACKSSEYISWWLAPRMSGYCEPILVDHFLNFLDCWATKPFNVTQIWSPEFDGRRRNCNIEFRSRRCDSAQILLWPNCRISIFLLSLSPFFFFSFSFYLKLYISWATTHSKTKQAPKVTS